MRDDYEAYLGLLREECKRYGLVIHGYGGADNSALIGLAQWRQVMSPDHWREELTRIEDQVALETLRTQTYRGRPLGTDRFLSKVEKFLGRRVRPLPVGRPRTTPHKR